MKKVLMIVGSMRKKSFNRQLAAIAAELLRGKAEVAVLIGCGKVGIVELLVGIALLFLCGKIYGVHKRKMKAA